MRALSLFVCAPAAFSLNTGRLAGFPSIAKTVGSASRTNQADAAPRAGNISLTGRSKSSWGQLEPESPGHNTSRLEPR